MLIGATTENPSFEVNAALLSRSKVFVLKPLDEAALGRASSSAPSPTRSAASAASAPEVTDEALGALARSADGDARSAP